MKILWRTLIILLAVAVVTGATLGAMQLPAVQTWIESQGGGHGGPPGMAEGEFLASPVLSETTASATGSSDDSSAGADVLAAASDEAAANSTATTATGEQARPMRGEGGGHSGGNLQGLVEVARNLGIVVAASLAIAALGWAGKRLRPRRRAAAAAL